MAEPEAPISGPQTASLEHAKEQVPPAFRKRAWTALTLALVAIVVTLGYAIEQVTATHDLCIIGHERQPVWENIFQVACVILLSYLAFEVHELPVHARDYRWGTRSRWMAAVEAELLHGKFAASAALIVMFVTPSVLFLFAMMDKYQAAVFTMALIAIFVAAEHFSGLTEQKRLLEKQDAVARDLRRHVDSLAHVFGLEQGKQLLYDAYRETSSGQKITAIIKYFDIDAVWWQTAEDDDWGRYENSGASGTLYDSLLKSPCSDILFVCDMALPVGDGLLNSEYAKQFNNLAGMAWQWIVLDSVAKKRGDEYRFQIRIASASSWMHVADGKVFQILLGDVPANNRVRDLTLTTASNAPVRLVEWAEGEIEYAAEGSCSAEEYLCATLCRQAQQMVKRSDEDLDDAQIEKILQQLGMNAWISFKHDFLARPDNDEDLQKQCCALFKKFLMTVKGDKRRAVSLSRPGLNEREKQAREGRELPGCSIEDLRYELL